MTAAAPAEQISPVSVGEVIGGKYRVERVLGIGGMGVVVAATHLQLDQRVALKFLRAEAKDNDEVVERFTREARAAAKITSEHVGRVMDVGRLERGELFMVMEYLEGRDLSDALQVEKRIALPRAVEYVLQACEAIAEAHVHGIVHRDLKPANLFLARRVDGTQIIKVLDFGISKLTLARPDGAVTDPSLTNPTAVMGSPLYMSPEQMHSSMRVDARSDIWALGIILYEMVTGRTPFEAESIPLIHAAILHNAPPPLRERAPNLPARFEPILLKCLEKEPSRRYQDVAELVGALAQFSPRQGRVSLERVSRLKKAARSDRPPGVPAAGLPAAPDPAAPSSTITAWGEDRKRSSMRRTGVLLAVLLLLGGAAAAVATGIIPLPPQLRPEPASTEVMAPPPTPPPPSADGTAAGEAPSAPAPAPVDSAAAEEALTRAKEQAGRLYKSANAKFQVRDYTGAAELYVQADSIYPGAKPKYKAAICFDKLQRRDDAIDWYERFLASEPDPASFPNGEITESKRRLQALKRTAPRPRPKASPTEAKTAEPAASAATSAAPTATAAPSSPDPTKGFGDRE